MDFLVVKSLKDIQLAIKLIQEKESFNYKDNIPKYRQIPYKGEGYDVWDLPQLDEIYDDICSGKTETVFQFNTHSAMTGLRNFNYINPKTNNKLINSIFDASVFTALDRPGPLKFFVEINGNKHNMLVEYARRCRGETPAETPEIFNEMLPETHGILVFQEQLMKMYQTLTGCTLEEAESFRSDMGKKKKEKILKLYPAYLERASKKVGEIRAIEAWKAMETFAGYSFNLSHSSAYCAITYTCTYIKHFYPLEWWCAVLTHADRNKISEEHWRYCHNFVNLPDIKMSKDYFYINGDRIQAPLGLIEGIGENAQKQIAMYSPYRDIQDFCEKIKQFKEDNRKENGKLGHSAVNRKVIYSLITSGVCDSLFPENSSILDKLELFETEFKKVNGGKAQKVSEKYNMNPFEVYSIRKKILPVYSDDLRKLVDNTKLVKVSNGYLYSYKNDNLSVISGEELERLDLIKLPIGELKAAIVGYIIKQRPFKFANNTKEACEFHIDCNGVYFKFVMWPGKNGLLSKEAKKTLTDSIVLVVLSKRTTDKPFTIQKLEILNEREEDTDEV
jgi:DNA polymerase III alpha subunit